jgi:hypothetical protein
MSSRRFLVTAVALVGSVSLARAQFAGLPNDARLARLQQWLAAVERHQPGIIDDAARTVLLLPHAAVAEIRDDMQTIGTLVHDAGARIGRDEQRDMSSNNRRQPGGYTRNQVSGLRAIAKEIANRRTITELLKRGSLLHTDVAFRAPPDGSPVGLTSSPALQRTTLLLEDGRQRGLEQSISHLSPVLALDMSESVKGERLDHLRMAGHALLDGLLGDDRAALMTFSHAVAVAA